MTNRCKLTTVTIVVRSAIAKVCHSEEMRWGRLKMRDLMLKYNG